MNITLSVDDRTVELFGEPLAKLKSPLPVA